MHLRDAFGKVRKQAEEIAAQNERLSVIVKSDSTEGEAQIPWHQFQSWSKKNLKNKRYSTLIYVLEWTILQVRLVPLLLRSAINNALILNSLDIE